MIEDRSTTEADAGYWARATMTTADTDVDLPSLDDLPPLGMSPTREQTAASIAELVALQRAVAS